MSQNKANAAFDDPSVEFHKNTRFSPFNELMTVSRHKLIELKSTYGLSNLRDIIVTQNGGTISFTGDGEFQLSTDSQSNSLARLESGEIGRYVPGYGAESGKAVRIENMPAGDAVKEWGYFDEILGEGFYFSLNSENVGVAIRRNGTEIRWPQNVWNIDKLDGNGPSGLEYKMDRGNIYQIVYSWYGYGDITWMIQVPLEQVKGRVGSVLVPVHTFVPYGKTSISDPNLPITVQIKNNSSSAAHSMYVAGRQYSILGDYVPNRRFTTEILRSVSVPDNGDGPFTAVTAHRRKSGTSRGVSVKLDALTFISGNNLEYDIRSDVTGLDGTYGSIRRVNSDETALEGQNINGTGGGTALTTSNDDGDQVYGDIVSGGNKNSSASSSTGQIGLDLIRQKPIVVLANSLAGNSATFSLVARYREEW